MIDERIKQLEAELEAATQRIADLERHNREGWFEERARAEAAEARLTAVEVALRAQWQPIETAPKDGRLIIAYQPGGIYGNGIVYPASVGMASWWKGDALNEPAWIGPLNPRDYPTHWMPLPDPPSLDALLSAATPENDTDA